MHRARYKSFSSFLTVLFDSGLLDPNKADEARKKPDRNSFSLTARYSTLNGSSFIHVAWRLHELTSDRETSWAVNSKY